MPEPQKIRRLKKLNASEVSLVNRGAIRRPFLVIKNQEGLAMGEQATAVVPQLNQEQEARFESLISRYATVAKADGDDAGVAEGEGLDDRCMAALKAVYRILQPFKGQIPEDAVHDVLDELDLDDTGEDGQSDDADDDASDDEQDNNLQEEEQAMAKNFDPEDLKKAADWSPTKPDGMSDEDHQKAVAAAKAAYASSIGKGADDDDEDDDEDDDDVKKSAVKKAALPAMSAKHAELIAKAESARVEAESKVQALAERVAKMEDEAQLKLYESSVRQDCQVLGKNPAEQARIVKSAYSAGKEMGDAYMQLLKDSAAMTHQTGIFKSVGTSSNASFGGDAVPNLSGSPQQQLNAMLNACVQKGDAKDEAQAWNVVMKTAQGQAIYERIHGGKN